MCSTHLHVTPGYVLGNIERDRDISLKEVTVDGNVSSVNGDVKLFCASASQAVRGKNIDITNSTVGSVNALGQANIRDRSHIEQNVLAKTISLTDAIIEGSVTTTGATTLYKSKIYKTLFCPLEGLSIEDSYVKTIVLTQQPSKQHRFIIGDSRAKEPISIGNYHIDPQPGLHIYQHQKTALDQTPSNFTVDIRRKNQQTTVSSSHPEQTTVGGRALKSFPQYGKLPVVRLTSGSQVGNVIFPAEQPGTVVLEGNSTVKTISNGTIQP